MVAVLYVGAILVANLLSTYLPPVNIGPFAVSPGTFTIAFSFILRDLVQNRYGRLRTYLFIALALVLSAALADISGDPLAIVVASAVAFAISETTDTEIYTRLRLPMHLRVWWSGLFGGLLDSAAFVTLGLSPIGMGFLSWNVIPMAIIGQALFKILMQGIGALGVYMYYKRANEDPSSSTALSNLLQTVEIAKRSRR